MNGWMKVEKRWLKIASITNRNTNESVEWSHSHTIVLTYMLDRFSHFTRNGAEFFDNQDSLAEQIGIGITTLKSRLNDLIKIGAVVVTKKKLRGFVSSNSYTVLDAFNAPMFEVTLLSGEVIRAETPKKFVFDKAALGIGVSDPDAPF